MQNKDDRLVRRTDSLELRRESAAFGGLYIPPVVCRPADRLNSNDEPSSARLASGWPSRTVRRPGEFVTATLRKSRLLWFAGPTVSCEGFTTFVTSRREGRDGPFGLAHFALPIPRWNYGLDGSLKGMPEFDGVNNFVRSDNGWFLSKQKSGKRLYLSISIQTRVH